MTRPDTPLGVGDLVTTRHHGQVLVHEVTRVTPRYVYLRRPGHEGMRLPLEYVRRL